MTLKEREILLMSIDELANIIKKNQITCYNLCKIFINQINKYENKINGMAYNCFEDALNIAMYYDLKYKKIKLKDKKLLSLPKYFGVPITVKASFELQGKPFTLGYTDRKNILGKKLNPLCSRLIKHGMIIIASTNIPEGSSWIESSNKLYGTTSNPYDLNRTAGGSSGGSAALVAICGSPISLCSDALGSIRIPALYNGIFGHKTTGGCINGWYCDSNDGEAESPDILNYYAQGGILCKYSKELWPITNLLMENNIYSKLVRKYDYSNLKLDQVTFIYIGESFKNNMVGKLDYDIYNSIHNMLTTLKNKNINVEFKNYIEFEYTALIIISEINNHFDTNGDISTKSIWSNFKELTLTEFSLSLTSKVLDNKNAENILSKMLSILKTKLKREFQNNDNTVLIAPTMGIVAPYHNTSIKHIMNIIFTGIFNILKLPVTQIPLGLNYKGLPLGCQIIGNKYQDKLTMKVAELLEEANISKWIPPKLIN